MTLIVLVEGSDFGNILILRGIGGQFLYSKNKDIDVGGCLIYMLRTLTLIVTQAIAERPLVSLKCEARAASHVSAKAVDKRTKWMKKRFECVFEEDVKTTADHICSCNGRRTDGR